MIAMLFGIPNEGIHKTRFMGIAFYDLVGTLALAAVTSYFTKWCFFTTFVLWFIFGEILHWIFGVKTAIMKTLLESS